MNKLKILPTALASALIWTSAAAQAKNPQYIAISFDGSYQSSSWEATQQMAKEAGAKVTYFVSGVYFITEAERNRYQAPGKPEGRSDIGVGDDREDVLNRVHNVLEAADKGHEIGSHANGHFDGSKWSFDAWLSEFNQFHNFLFEAISNNKLLSMDRSLSETQWKNLMRNSIKGFRAPLLGVSKGLWKVMGKTDWSIGQERFGRRYFYDASRIAEPGYIPQKTDGGVWNFPLTRIKVLGGGYSTLSMDYNFYANDSKGIPDKNPANQARYEKQMYNSYMAWFKQTYNGNRAPMSIGHHFSMWNGGAYFRALSRFAKAVCRLPDVKCVTYTELVEALEGGSIDNSIASREVDIPNPRPRPKRISFSEMNTKENSQKLYTLEELQKMGDRTLMGDLPEAHFE